MSVTYRLWFTPDASSAELQRFARRLGEWMAQESGLMITHIFTKAVRRRKTICRVAATTNAVGVGVARVMRVESSTMPGNPGWDIATTFFMSNSSSLTRHGGAGYGDDGVGNGIMVRETIRRLQSGRSSQE